MKLSIRIITYNQAAYVMQAMDSVLSQKTNFPFEIVIGDDASTDGTKEILESYAREFPDKIKLTLHEKNLGERKNLLTTLVSCSGEFVAFLDGDDYWTDDLKLQKQIDFLDANPEYSICFHNARLIDTDKPGFSMEVNKFKNSVFQIEDIIKNNWFMMTSSLMMRNPNPLPNWFFDSVNKNIDYSLQLVMSLKGKAFYFQEVMSVYRQHNDSLAFKFDLLEWCNSLFHIINHFDADTNNKYIGLTNDKRASVCLRVVKEYSVFTFQFWKNLFVYFRFKQNLKFSDVKEISSFLVYKYYNLIKGKK